MVVVGVLRLAVHMFNLISSAIVYNHEVKGLDLLA